MIYVIVYNHCSVYINVVNNGCVHRNYRGVITEVAAIPVAAHKTRAAVAIAVIDTTVETYVRPPIACMKTINAAIITPISRRP
jgi:hypothetical protein